MKNEVIVTPVKAASINWKGLYKDSKWSWLSLFSIALLIFSTVLYLSLHGYFSSRQLGDIRSEKIKVLDVTNYLGNRVLIEGQISNHVPIEVKMPKGCIVNKDWINKTVKVDVITKYRPFNNTEFFEFPGLSSLCIQEEIKKDDIITKEMPNKKEATIEKQNNIDNEKLKKIDKI